MSSGRLGPPSRTPSCRRRRNDASPPGPDSRSTALPMTACSSAAQRRVPRPVPALRVQFDAEPDQVLQGVDVDVAGDDGGHRGVAGDGRGGVAVQPGAVVAAGLGRRAPGGRPTGPGPARSTAPAGPSRRRSSSRSASEMCTQALTGCPARSGSSPAAVSRRIASASASWYRWSLVRSSSFPAGARQRVQHRRHGRGALGGQVPVHDAGAAEGGGQLHLTVRELPARVLIGQVRRGPARTSRANSARQVPQPQPGGEGGQQLLVRRVPVLLAAACRSTGRSAARRTPTTFPAASAASTRGWVVTRLAHAVCPTAAPRVIPVRCISQDTAL